MLKTRSIGLNIAGVPLLNNISVSCPKGSVTALMGPNGAGKTSLLRVISGEYKASQGTVDINGRGAND